MNRFLQSFNFLGIVVLALLCARQWRVNSTVNLRANNLEIIRQEQQAKLAENDKTIKGYAADLDDLRQRLSLAETQLKDQEAKLNLVTTERNQLSAALPKWIAAVTDRDAALKRAGDQLQQLAKDRNDAIAKFNDLANKYNALAKDWNDQQAKRD